MTDHVRFNNVSVRYASHSVLRRVSATIPLGAFTAVIGPNGSGKSTMLSLLTGHHPAYSGQVSIEGTDITHLAGRRRAAEIGVLRQDSGPLPDVTVAELVALGPRTLPRPLVERALNEVGVAELADQPVPTLSGGQLQRTLLARAIRHRPRLLVLDEPTNHLDIHHQIAILDLVKQMGITVISALHDLDFASRYADEVLVLSKGELHTQGPPAQAITTELLRDIFHVTGETVTTSTGERHVVFSRLPLVGSPEISTCQR